MNDILKHLSPREQYKYLQRELAGVIEPENLATRIQEILDEINKK